MTKKRIDVFSDDLRYAKEGEIFINHHGRLVKLVHMGTYGRGDQTVMQDQLTGDFYAARNNLEIQVTTRNEMEIIAFMAELKVEEIR